MTNISSTENFSPNQSISQKNTLYPAITSLFLTAIFLIMRIPFRSRILFNWDSINYALGILDFNVLKHRPHPPGYIFYINFAQIVNQWFNDPNTSLVWISVLSGLITVLFTYAFARKRFNQGDAIVVALLIVTNPLLWFYNELALNYSLEAFFSISIAFSYFQSMKGSKRWALMGILLLGIGGGFRQTILLILLPLTIFVLLRQPWKIRLSAVAILFLTCLAWGLPLLQSTGGLENYLTASQNLSQTLEAPTLLVLLIAFFYAGHIPLLFTLASLLRIIPIPPVSFEKWEKIFLALWIVPNFLTISLFHIGQSGYLLFFLPPLLIYTPFLIRNGLMQLEKLFAARQYKHQPSLKQKTNTLIALLLFINIVSFFTGGYIIISVQNHTWKDTYLLPNQYSPSETIVLTNYDLVKGFRHASYYLSEYHVYGFSISTLSGPFYHQKFIAGWIFQSYQLWDDYELNAENNQLKTTLDLPPNTKGLIVTDPVLAEKIIYYSDGQPVSLETRPINQFFVYIPLPENSSRILISQGNLVIQQTKNPVGNLE